MRVLIFSIVYYPLYIGGAEVAVKEITDRLGEIEFDMITLKGRGEAPFERIGNVNIYRVGQPLFSHYKLEPGGFPAAKYLYPLLVLLKGASLQKKNKYDATWSIMANYAGFAALLFKLFFPRVKFILTLQEGDPLEHIKKRVGIFFFIFTKIFTKADKIQAISNFLAEWAKEMGHRGTIEVIPNGVNVKKFKPIHSSTQKEGKEMKLITTSRLVRKNGVGDIIAALPLLPEEVRLQIIGVGHLETSLKAQVVRLNLEKRVQFLGFKSLDEIPSYLHQAQIFVRPALSEGFGNSFIEAMAAGLPVVATPVGGIVDFVVDPSSNSGQAPSNTSGRSDSESLQTRTRQVATGFFCEPENPQSVAKAVMRVIDNPDLVEQVRKNASQMVEEHYDWNMIAHKMREQVFNQV